MNDLVREKLQGHVPIQLVVPREPYNAHATSPENSDKRIAREQSLPGTKAPNGRILRRRPPRFLFRFLVGEPFVAHDSTLINPL